MKILTQIQLKPCPFCGKIPDMEDGDTIYPSGVFWRDSHEGRIYEGIKGRLETDNVCWMITCPEVSGGCSAEMHGDSVEEVIAKWNHRI